MKVLQINSVCGIGSTGRIATDIHTTLKENGHESYIAYGREPHQKCDNAIKIGSKIDIYNHVLKTRILDRHGFGSKKATENFIKKINKLNPDIIHLHNIHGYYINIELLFDYLKTINKPIVWTLHDCWPVTGHCSHFDYTKCQCWTGNIKCINKTGYPASYFLNNSKKNIFKKKAIFSGLENVRIVTPSFWLADIIKNTFLKQYQIQVINNGVDINIFKPKKSDFRRKYDLENKYIILGVASVWTEQKGLDYFLKLASDLRDDEQVVLVGLTKRQINRLPESIIGIEKTNNINELSEIYSTVDIYINLTLEDTYPTTNLEALACGTPIITFKTGGSVESVQGNCGKVVEQGDIAEVIKVIDLYKRKTNNEKEIISFECRKLAEENFNKQDKYKKYMRLYDELLLKH